MCSTYEIKINDIFNLIQIEYFYKLCKSYDKTNLFILTLTKIFFYTTIYLLFEEITNKNEIIEIITNIIYFIILLNIFNLFVVVSKVPTNLLVDN